MGKKNMRYHSQTMIFHIPSTVSKDLFIEYALKIVGERYVHVECKNDRLTLEIQGLRTEVRDVVSKLSAMSNQINNAVDKKGGQYVYDLELLNQFFKPQLRLIFFAKALEIYGYKSSTTATTLSTTANYFDLERVHAKIANAMIKMQSNQHKDIERFFTLLHLISDLEMFEMGDIAVENGLMKFVEGHYQFAVDQGLAYNKMIELLAKPEQRPEIEIPENDEFVLDDFFDGGKIVFMKNGDELDSSPFDIVSESENREE